MTDSRRSDPEAIDNDHRTGGRCWCLHSRGIRPNRPSHLVILSYVDGHDIDPRAVEHTAVRGVERYLLGSVSEKVVRLAETPVLTGRLADSDDPS